MIDDREEDVGYEDVLDSEIDDIWDIFFPYTKDKKEVYTRLDDVEAAQTKPRRYLKFLSM